MSLTNAMKIDKITVVLTWLGPLLYDDIIDLPQYCVI